MTEEETMNSSYNYDGHDDPTSVEKFARECTEQDIRKCHEAGVWVTKDGRRVPVGNLADEHLGNILRMLQRVAEVDRLKELKVYLMVDTSQMGDVTADAIEMEAEGLIEKTWRQYTIQPIFRILETEATNRKLEWNRVKDEKWWMMSHDIAIMSQIIDFKEKV